jgi:putative FmdB family regulatory protein
MPLFEYRCSECGLDFEKIVPTHTTRVVCESCGSRKVEKKLSVFAVAGGGSDESFEGGCGTCGAERPGMCQM